MESQPPDDNPAPASRLLAFRYFSVIAVVAAAAGAVLMFVIGAVKIAKAWIVFIPEGFTMSGGASVEANSAIAYIAQGIDAFLIALVLVVFGSGIINVAIRHDAPPRRKHGKGMFEIHSMGQLKATLAELVVIILFVKFLEVSLDGDHSAGWETLVLPAGALFLAAALKLLNLRKEE